MQWERLYAQSGSRSVDSYEAGKDILLARNKFMDVSLKEHLATTAFIQLIKIGKRKMRLWSKTGDQSRSRLTFHKSSCQSGNILGQHQSNFTAHMFANQLL